MKASDIDDSAYSSTVEYELDEIMPKRKLLAGKSSLRTCVETRSLKEPEAPTSPTYSVKFHERRNSIHVITDTSLKEESRWEILINALRPIFSKSKYKKGKARRVTFDSGMFSWLERGGTMRSPRSPAHSRSSSFDSAKTSPSVLSYSAVAASDREKQDAEKSQEKRRASFDDYVKRRRATRPSDKIKEALDRIKKIKIPLSLLKRRGSEFKAKHIDGASEMFSIAVSAPFFRFANPDSMDYFPTFIGNIHVDIKDSPSEDSTTRFQINLKYGDMEWSINRTLVEFLKLHSYLSFYQLQQKISGLPKFPSQLHYAISKAKVVALPQTNDMLTKDFLLSRMSAQRRRALEDYLSDVLLKCQGKYCPDLYVFLELGTVVKAGWKGKEGYLKKGQSRTRICGIFPKFRRGKTVWAVVRDSYMAYFDRFTSEAPSEVIIFDTSTLVEERSRVSKNPMNKHKFKVKTINIDAQFRAESDRQFNEFVKDIDLVIGTNPWSRPHRYESFAPIRDNIKCNFHIDGNDYFDQAYEAILNAKDTIYIEDWWLSPELYLKRPPAAFPESRIDHLLKRKAEEGVLIYIVIYKEVSYALTIDSYHTKFTLVDLHRNIKVMRYPDHVPGGVLYWALHEKLLIVDENLAFLGGLDLCFGRYDTQKHQVGDYLPGSLLEAFPGQDFSNPRIKDFKNVATSYNEGLINKAEIPRMPWHDVHASFEGQAARDIARHFVQRWNFIKTVKSKDRDDLPFLLPPSELSRKQAALLNMNGTCRFQLIRSCSFWSMGVPVEHSIWNAYMENIHKAEHFLYIENQFFISGTNQSTDLPYTVRNRIAQAIVDRIVKAYSVGRRFRVYVVIPLYPAFENEVDDVNAATLRLIVHWQQMTAWRGEYSIIGRLRSAGITNPDDYITFCSLRTHGKLHSVGGNDHGDIVTEQVYIHSKLLIIDDRVVIIGSANINDRSMIGSRDSEIAAVVEDKKLVPSKMDGKPYLAAEFALQFRKRLFAEHLGLVSTDAILNDPITDEFYYQVWRRTADINTGVYRDMFRCVPDDTVTTWEEYEEFTEVPFRPEPGHLAVNAPIEIVERVLKRVKGHLVFHPLCFLAKESLNLIFPAKETLISTDVFV